MPSKNRYTVVAAIAVLSLSTTAVSNDVPTCRAGELSPAASEAVTLKAVGDIVLGNNWPTGGWPVGFEQDAQRQLKRVLGDADVIFGNFEGVLTTHNISTKTPRGTAVFAFRMPSGFAPVLKNAGFNVLAIANNHTLDFGQTGFQDTLAHLSKAGILTIGAPNQVAVQKAGGVTLAWIGFSHLQHHNYIGDRDKLAELVGQARSLADLVIVSMQAGAEGSEALKVRNSEETFMGENRGNTFSFARQAIDLGADLVIGHGPHVLRGMECYKGKLIAYSLGNFAGYGTLSTKRAAAISAVLEVKLAKNRQTLGFNVIPVKFDERRLPEVDPDKLAHYLINDLSRMPPLNGSVSFPVARDGEANYRRWLSSSDLTRILSE